jgi:hypothetical protein
MVVQAGQLTGVREWVVIVHHHDPVVGNGGDALAVSRLAITIKGECQRLRDNSSEDLPRRRAQLNKESTFKYCRQCRLQQI